MIVSFRHENLAAADDVHRLLNEYSATVGTAFVRSMLISGRQLGDERYDPDRPSVLPSSTLRTRSPEHPYYSKKDTFSGISIRQPRRSAMSSKGLGQSLHARRPAVDAKLASSIQIVTDLAR